MSSYLWVIVARLVLLVGGGVVLDHLLIDQAVNVALGEVSALRSSGGVLFQQVAKPFGVSLDRIDLV